MLDKKTFLAIIPARGGSKRLPKKNVLEIEGKPLISYTIEAAIKSRYIDDIVVTSDDTDILDIAQKHNVLSLNRPEEFASDTATSQDVALHVIDTISKEYDYILLLQPTSPLRNHSNIDESIEQLIKQNADNLVSVCEVEHSPLWCNTLDKTLSMSNFIDKKLVGKRSQELDLFYRLNGAIYIVKTELFLKEKSFLLDENSFAYVMEKRNSIDIDDEYDFLIAQTLITLEDTL